MYCYDFDGNLVWKTSLGKFAKMGMGNGMSPVLYENLVIVQCDQEDGGPGSFIAALNKLTGKEVWRVPRTQRKTWATPVLVQTAQRTELIASGAESTVSYDPATGSELMALGRRHLSCDSERGDRPRHGFCLGRLERSAKARDRHSTGGLRQS